MVRWLYPEIYVPMLGLLGLLRLLKPEAVEVTMSLEAIEFLVTL